LLRASDGERSNAVAQLLSRARHFLVNLSLGGGELAIAFQPRFLPRVIDELLAALFRLRQDLGRASARLLDGLAGLARGELERAAALLGRGEPVGDGFLPLLDL